VHISELANHHVENPREVVQPGDDVRVKILEIDSDRRRLSLSVKRVEGQVLPRRDTGAGAGDLDDVPELGLSEDVFAGGAGEGAQSASGPVEPVVAEDAVAPGDEAAATDE
jgi:dephospho-CoA kinase